MQGGEELTIEELTSNISTYKEQLQQVILFPIILYNFTSYFCDLGFIRIWFVNWRLLFLEFN